MKRFPIADEYLSDHLFLLTAPIHCQTMWLPA